MNKHSVFKEGQTVYYPARHGAIEFKFRGLLSGDDSKCILKDVRGKIHVRLTVNLCLTSHEANLLYNLKEGDVCWYFETDDSEIGYSLKSNIVKRIVSFDLPVLNKQSYERKIFVFFKGEVESYICANEAFWSRKLALNLHTSNPGGNFTISHFDFQGEAIPFKSFIIGKEVVCMN